MIRVMVFNATFNNISVTIFRKPFVVLALFVKSIHKLLFNLPLI